MNAARCAIFCLAIFVGLTCWPFGPVRAQTSVDVALVLAVDASGSIDGDEFKLQKEGIAQAITNAEVLKAIASGRSGRIAIAYVEWGGPQMARTVVAWMIVADSGSANGFAQALLAAPRSAQSYNAIGDAIDHAVALLAGCGCRAARRVIDISGDNVDMRSARPAHQARDEAVRQGIVINALAVLDTKTQSFAGRPTLAEYFEAEVIGGMGAFVITAKDRADFTRAMRQKMIQEIAGAPPRRNLAQGQR